MTTRRVAPRAIRGQAASQARDVHTRTSESSSPGTTRSLAAISQPESLTDIAYEALITMIRHCEGNPDARPNYTSDYNGRDVSELVGLIDAMQDEYPNMFYQVSDDGMTLWFRLDSEPEPEPEPVYVPPPVTAPRIPDDSRSAYERQMAAARRQRDLALGR